MVSFLSAIPTHCARGLRSIPRLLGVQSINVKPVAPPQSSADLAKRKVHHLTPFLGYLSGSSTQDLNKKWSHYLEKVSCELLALPELSAPKNAPVQDALKQILNNLEFKNLELFFERLAKAEIEKPSSRQVSDIFNLIDLKKIESCIKSKNPYFNGAKTWAEELSQRSTGESKQVDTASRTRNVVTQFFPNLGYTLRRAFDLFDSSHPPSSLYEYGVLITMYFHFFCLPYILFKALSAVIASSATVLLTATLIIGLTVGLLYAYLRWVRTCPKQVIFCENLSEKNRKGELHPVVGREEEFRQALACLNSAKKGTTVHLLLVGEPGVGKTEFMNGLAQRLHNREVFKFKNWSLFGAPGAIQSPGEKMETAFREVTDFEQIPVFCCDELGDAKDQLLSFLKPVLNNRSIQFVGAMTKDQYEKFKAADKAFEERFKPIFFNPTNKEQTIRIMNEHIRRTVPDLCYSQKALEKIFELSELRGHCQPRRAITILDQLINNIAQFNIAQFATSQLLAAKESLQCMKAKACGIDSPLNRPMSQEAVLYMAECKIAQRKVDVFENEVRYKREQASRLSAMLSQENRIRRDVAAQAESLKTHSKVGIKEMRQFLLNSFFVVPQMSALIEGMKAQLDNKEIPLYLDELLVEKVIKEDIANRKAASAA